MNGQDVTVWLNGQHAASGLADADPVLAGLLADAVRLMERRGLTYLGIRLEQPAPPAGTERLATRGALLAQEHADERSELEARHAADRQAFETEVAVARQRAAMDALFPARQRVEDFQLPDDES